MWGVLLQAEGRGPQGSSNCSGGFQQSLGLAYLLSDLAGGTLVPPTHTHTHTQAEAKPTWSQVERHFLRGQLLLAALLVLLGLSQAPGVHDVVSRTSLQQ